MIEIREEQTRDAPAVRKVLDQAFGRPHEARVVERLRAGCHDLLSLVAVDGNRIAGHILFSPAMIHSVERPIGGMGLAPVAVLPECQRRGVGSALIREGISRLLAQGCPFIVVLGHPAYYPRFGFERASRYGIRTDWEVPDEAFLIRILDRTMLTGASGVCRYRSEFNEDVCQAARRTPRLLGRARSGAVEGRAPKVSGGPGGLMPRNLARLSSWPL